MSWQEVLTILIPIIGFMGWVYARIEKKADSRQAVVEKKFEAVEKRFEAVERRFDKVDKRFDKVDERLQSLDMRLTRLEGRFDERGYWESRKKTGTEER